MKSSIISHIRKESDGRQICQSNEEHCLGVACLAKGFAEEYGMGDLAYAMGLLHDKGKEKDEFQNYIRYENHLTDVRKYTKEGKAHAYVGALLAKEQLKLYAPLICNPIAGHHRGLYDYLDLEEELERPKPSEISRADLNGLTFAYPSWMRPDYFQKKDFHHVQRMLFSCLVDADYLDTERFMQPQQYELRQGKSTLAELLPKLEAYLNAFGEPRTEVNRIRAEIQQACRAKAECAPGFYSLTVPTGGGKTLSSLVWAMLHAVRHGKKRIIIAIPYTSIIVQTCAILKGIFGEENVLEHHSNVVVDEQKEGVMAHRLKLATENWDYPIIVTTNVQLFESMFSCKSSDCRKLHNICNSVLILDEVQTLPTGFLQPIVDSLDTYQRIFGLSVLFTTASQPILTGEHLGSDSRKMLCGLTKITEIIPPQANLHGRLRRVELHIDDTPSSYDDIAEKLMQHDRVLCIVNTRRDAKEIFDRLPPEGRIHLSRMMCPAHVSERIADMRKCLADPDNRVLRVVSTQLIEAGVDIDFPVVYRQEAGLDSILQAAGRCNREGKMPICTTHVFSLASEHALPQGYITQCNNARRNMVGSYDWFSPEAMNHYFQQLYCRIPSFDKNEMSKILYEQLKMEEASSKFRLIYNATTSVIVNWRESLSLIGRIQKEGPSYQLMHRLSQYCVNLRSHDFDKMLRDGIIEEVLEGLYMARGESQYNQDVGLLTDNQWLEETFIR